MTANSAREDRKKYWVEIVTSVEQASNVGDTKTTKLLTNKVGKKSVSCAPLRPSFLENKSILSPPSQPPPPTPETIKVFAPSELKLQTPSHQQNQPDESPTPHTAIPSKTVRAAIQSPVHRVLRPTAVMDSPFTESGEPTIRRCRRVGQNPYLASTPQPPAPLESTPVTVKRRKSPNSTLIVDDHFGGIMMPPPPSSTPVTVVKRPRRNAATSRPPTTSQYSTEPMEQSGGGRYNLRSRSRASSNLPSTDSSLSAINSTATSFNTPVAKTSTRSKRKGPAIGLELSVDGQKSYMSTRRKRKTSALQDSQTQFSAEVYDGSRRVAEFSPFHLCADKVHMYQLSQAMRSKLFTIPLSAHHFIDLICCSALICIDMTCCSALRQLKSMTRSRRYSSPFYQAPPRPANRLSPLVVRVVMYAGSTTPDYSGVCRSFFLHPISGDFRSKCPLSWSVLHRCVIP
ncbi:unnamed protein product [Schistocephalus solidus]|uniref:Flocculation protein FLO11-like n=1 Tax=Schistocephalus solidus TaxID=70667 RepID=A0A183THJ5_SCHSO|nr:unnamed protein product [Schistocephalus solidus]